VLVDDVETKQFETVTARNLRPILQQGILVHYFCCPESELTEEYITFHIVCNNICIEEHLNSLKYDLR
jgi:hypothetical protein